MTGKALATAAARLIGARFLVHGRDPAIGVDCVGLLAAALAATGRDARFPDTYSLRTTEQIDLNSIATRCGFDPCRPPFVAGDVPVVRVGACQVHLLIALGPTEFIHAHAGLRRVARHNGPLEWPIIGLWRLPDVN